MIFNAPEKMNGNPRKAGLDRNAPVRIGDREAPMVRATPVTPAAAERSSGATTAMVYDWRVGTSICEIEKRRSNKAIARPRLGMNGTRISRTLDGRWVNTMVLTSPIFPATQAALRAEMPARMLAPKKIAPSTAGCTPKFQL